MKAGLIDQAGLRDISGYRAAQRVPTQESCGKLSDCELSVSADGYTQKQGFCGKRPGVF